MRPLVTPMHSHSLRCQFAFTGQLCENACVKLHVILLATTRRRNLIPNLNFFSHNSTTSRFNLTNFLNKERFMPISPSFFQPYRYR